MFIFKDISFDEIGVVVQSAPVSKDENIDIIKVNCVYIGNEFTNNIEFITRFLNGSGNLIYKNDPEKYCNATIRKLEYIEKIQGEAYEIAFDFECEKYWHLFIGDDILTFTESNNKVFNLGNENSSPYFKIYGSGEITLYINDTAIQLKNVDGYIELDSEIQECFKDNELENRKMCGEFPIFSTEENIISWIGDVSKVEVIPRWRCL